MDPKISLTNIVSLYFARLMIYGRLLKGGGIYVYLSNLSNRGKLSCPRMSCPEMLVLRQVSAQTIEMCDA